MEVVAIIVALAALLIGLGIGWWLGGRGEAAARAEAQRREGDFKAAITDLALATQQAAELPALRAANEALRGERYAARLEVADLRARSEGADARLAEFVAAREAMVGQFRETAAGLLGEAQAEFLARAGDRFGEEGKANEARLKALLQPVEATLKRYEDNLAGVEKEREGSYRELREAVKTLHHGHTQVRDETAKLVNALRSSPKARGRWGEQSLKNVLEQAGLSSFADFQTEVSVNTADGRLRPDVVVRLPGGRRLIIDAKCSLNAFLDASDAHDDAVRGAHLKAHAAAIRRHAEQLGSKNYWEQFGEAADYVILYIPGEHFLFAALEQDDTLWDWAFQRRVLLATPTNLVAIARTVASVWRQEKLAEEAAEIARLGKELHARLATMGGHVARMGRNLELANAAYNSMVGSLEGQVMTQAKRFEALEVAGGTKSIEPLPMIEQAPRPLKKLGGDLLDAAE